MANTKKKVDINKIENAEVTPNEVVIEEKVEDTKNKIIEKSEICKARYADGLIYIDFKGYGLVTSNVDKHKEPELEVFYTGEIGEPDFKFRV